MTARLKAGLINSLLVIGSMLASYLVLEFFFFRLLLPALPLTLLSFTPSGADFFLQNAGRSFGAPGYIAVLGDSYAAGMGDWLRANGSRKDQPYHSVDVLRELLGTEVIGFGRPAVGSAEALVLRPTRIFDDGNCLAMPAVATPGRFLVYFYEGNDLDDNYDLVMKSIGAAAPDFAAATDRFLQNGYGRKTWWRCHVFFGDFIFRMARFLIKGSWRTLVEPEQIPDPRNQAVIAGVSRSIPPLQVPSMGLNEAEWTKAVGVFERSLAWLQHRFPQTPVTVVYIPSPATAYRFAGAEVASCCTLFPDGSVGRGPQAGRTFAVSAIYANSQRLCENVRAASLRARAGFIDTRPALRKTGAQAPLHGPNDWVHFNETGYRALAGAVAARIAQPHDACDDRWP